MHGKDVKHADSTDEICTEILHNYQYLGVNGPYVLRLDASTATRLARVALHALDELGLHFIELEPAPPYVITVRLPYSDFDRNQDTEAFNTAVLVESDRGLANQIVAACVAELALTKAFDPDQDARVWLDPIPEIKTRRKDCKTVTSVAEAVAHLRGCLLVHQSDNLTEDDRYWLNVGFAPGEWLDVADIIDTLHAVGDDGTGTAKLMVDFEANLPNNPDWAELPVLAKVRRWCTGLPVVEEGAGDAPVHQPG